MIQGARFPDFDVLIALHRDDPEALNTFRRRLLRSAVDHAPPEHRPSLEQLLLRIEAARDAADSPMEAAVTAFRMMRDSTSQLHSAWERAVQSVAELHAVLLIERVRAR